MKPLRIIFMGTPDFAVSPLQALISSVHEVVAIVTAPDKNAGRGQRVSQSPVKGIAISNNIPVLQPKNLKDSTFITELKSYNGDIQVVVAFRMLPIAVWQNPPLGTINLHASLLPQYRGAAPIHWALINGEEKTGLTTFFLKHEIDTGDIIQQKEIPISEDDNLGTLYKKMSEKGSQLLLDTVNKIATGNYVEKQQGNTLEIKHAPKINKSDCQINWNANALDIFNFVRGLNPWPCAYTSIFGFKAKIFAVAIVSNIDITIVKALTVGDYWTDNKDMLLVKVKDKYIRVLELQKEGKKRMPISVFLKGNQL